MTLRALVTHMPSEPCLAPVELDVVRGDAAVIHRLTDETEDETGIVVVQVGVRVFERALHVAHVEDRFLFRSICSFDTSRGVRVKQLPKNQ